MWSGQKDVKLAENIYMCCSPTLSVSWDLCPLFCLAVCPDRIGRPSASAPLLFNQALGLPGEKAAVFLKAPSRSKIYSENLLILQALVNGTDTSFFSSWEISNVSYEFTLVCLWRLLSLSWISKAHFETLLASHFPWGQSGRTLSMLLQQWRTT